MLVLSRKTDETIQIGDNIRVCVVEIRKGTVKLAIEAPREVPVHRDEVYRRLKDEARAATACAEQLAAAP